MHSRQKQRRRGNAQRPQPMLNRKIIAPQKLKILVLAGNQLLNQHLDFLSKCINLIKLDLSHNHITKLPDKNSLSSLNKLEVFHLHYNKIGSIEAIRPIYKCQTISYFTYHHNPLEVHVRNEHQIVNSLPNLKLINNRIIAIEERADYLLSTRPTLLADANMLQNWKSTQNSEAYYLRVLNMQLQYIDNLWAFYNPIVIIQRAWKHFLPLFQSPPSAQISQPRSVPSNKIERSSPRSRNKGTARTQRLQHPLKSYFENWKSFSQGLKAVRQAMIQNSKKSHNTDHMILPLAEYKRWLRNQKVNGPIAKYVASIRRKIYQKKMARLLTAQIKLKKTLFNGQMCFYQITNIKQSKRIYFSRSQQHILDNFITIIGEQFKISDMKTISKTQSAKQYNAIRLVDPESFCNKYNNKSYNTMCSLIWPSMKVVICKKKLVAAQFKSGFIGIPQLSYIKNRDKIVSPKQFKKSVDVYKRLQKFALNQYQTSLCYFQCHDQLVMKQLIRMIYYHNTKAIKFPIKQRQSQMLSLLENYEEPFILYVDSVLRRSCAAVTIQKTWRRYISNKSQIETIYQKMKKNRAALHIQRFFRYTIFRHRQFFQKQLNRDLSNLKTNTLVFPLSIFMNFSLFLGPRPQSILFKSLKMTRNFQQIGLSEQYFRPLFQQNTRNDYFSGQRLGTENYYLQIDIYHLLHFNVQITIIQRNGSKFISLGYSNEKYANITASIIAMLTYQFWGSEYLWPLTLDNLPQWADKIKRYQLLKKIRAYVPKFQIEQQSRVPLSKKAIEEHGLFLWCSGHPVNLNQPHLSIHKIGVEFYQKRLHSFPVKQAETLAYTILNEELEFDVEKNEQKEQDQIIPPKTEPRLDGPLSITMIDRRQFTLFDQSEKTLKQSRQEEINPMSRTEPVIDKKQKVLRFYKDELVKRQAQKQVKESNLAGIRDKARQQKILNSTLRSLKQAERSEALRSKVQRIKDYKARALSRKQEEDFVQQNNFVMQQQLKMVIMRGRMKDSESKREDFMAKKSSMDRHSSKMAPSIQSQSRKSSRQKMRVEVEDRHIDSNIGATIGDEGSVINRRRARRSRAHSIGAYMRDPSFVHGVFPEEYYPIESRGTSFYFPPVV